MTRIQVASYCLLASAFVLAGILFSKLDSLGGRQAHADMVVNRDNFTFMTARSSPNSEALFVLDNFSEKLLVYECNISRKQINLTGSLDLGKRGGVDDDGRKQRGRNR